MSHGEESDLCPLQIFVHVYRKHSSILAVGKSRQDGAASTIQQRWRKRQAVARQERYQKENEESIINLQSVLKAHLARKRSFPTSYFPEQPVESEAGLQTEEADSEDSSDAIEMVQAALKGHLTRQMVLQDHQQRE